MPAPELVTMGEPIWCHVVSRAHGCRRLPSILPPTELRTNFNARVCSLLYTLIFYLVSTLLSLPYQLVLRVLQIQVSLRMSPTKI